MASKRDLIERAARRMWEKDSSDLLTWDEVGSGLQRSYIQMAADALAARFVLPPGDTGYPVHGMRVWIHKVTGSEMLGAACRPDATPVSPIVTDITCPECLASPGFKKEGGK